MKHAGSGKRFFTTLVSVTALGALVLGAGAAGDEPPPDAPAQEPAPEPQTPEGADRIRRIVEYVTLACPAADPADAAARDAAADRLRYCGDLIDAADERLLWGAVDPDAGVDPEEHELMALAPQAWACMYLSCFIIEGPASQKAVDGFTVVELPAHFRSRLPLNDYPHSLWHKESEWLNYVSARAILLIFDGDTLVASYYVPGPSDEPPQRPAPEWDRRWTWTDDTGAAQPRYAQFDRLLSRENPHLRTLGEAYAALLPDLESQGCLKCHAPNNRSRARSLTALGYPNHALVAHESLVDVLRENSMPPADAARGWEKGIREEEVRRRMLAAAERFRDEAIAALSYEGVHYERPEEDAVPMRNPWR